MSRFFVRFAGALAFLAAISAAAPVAATDYYDSKGRIFGQEILYCLNSAGVPVLVSSGLCANVPTNPISTLTPTTTTTQYGANTLIANNATPASIVVPYFTVPNPGATAIPSLELQNADFTAGAWGGESVQVDLWSCAPTFANGDRGAWLTATGSACHLGAFSCALSPAQGDGEWAECAPAVGNFAGPFNLAAGAKVYWTLEAIGGSGAATSAAQKLWTLTAHLSYL